MESQQTERDSLLSWIEHDSHRIDTGALYYDLVYKELVQANALARGRATFRAYLEKRKRLRIVDIHVSLQAVEIPWFPPPPPPHSSAIWK